MNRCQRGARLVIAAFGMVFAVFVARELKRRDPPAANKPVVRTDPGAIVETTRGNTTHVTGTREDVFITTKFNREWHSYDGAHRAFDASAARLGVEYIDLLLIH